MIGAGAVGGMIGGRLALAGRRTVWVARGEHGRTLKQDGITILSAAGEERATSTVWLDPAEAELRPDDVLVLAVKTQDAEDALAVWADLPVSFGTDRVAAAGECLPIVLATNGVAAEAMAMRYFQRVVGMCVWAPNVHLSPGVVVTRFAPDAAVLHCSRVPASLTDDTDREMLALLRDDFRAARMDVPLPDDVMPWKCRKLISNLGNVVDALVGPDADDVADLARVEAAAVLRGAGIAVVDDATESAARRAGPRVVPVPGAPAELGGSTWQSLAKGRGSLETDYLNGEIVAIAHAAGLEAPVNSALARLGRRAAAAGTAPRSMSADDLRTAVRIGGMH